MKRLQKTIRETGKVLLALLTGIFMPLLVWAGLGVAINRKAMKKAAQPGRVPVTGDNLAENPAPVNDKKH